jgi:hypothetical protein
MIYGWVPGMLTHIQNEIMLNPLRKSVFHDNPSPLFQLLLLL